MKLLYITNGITGSGGLERVLSVKASLLVEKFSYQIAIVSLNEKNVDPFYSFHKKIKFYNIAFDQGNVQNLLSYIKGINEVVREFEPDVISVCDDGLKAFFLPKIINFRIPIVYERHVSKEIEMRDEFSFWKKQIVKAKWNLMERLAVNFSKFIVLTSGNLKEWSSLKNIEIIPNPLPFNPDNSSTLNNKKVLIVGKQSYQKGQDLLLQAWKLVKQKHPEWILEIVGKFDDSIGLKKKVSELGLTNHVKFYAPQKNIEDKYLDASIYVMSSRYEGFGMVLIEAMAFGVPCISFNCNYGPADIIKSNVNGVLVRNGDITALATAIIELIDNPEKRKAMGYQAKVDAQNYLPKEIVKQWDELFIAITND